MLPLPDAVVPYLRDAEFGDTVPFKDFVVQHEDVRVGGATARCHASDGSTAGGVEEGVLLIEAYMAAGPCLSYATDGRPEYTPTVCKVLHLVTDQRLPDDGQVEQLGPFALAATASELWVVLCVVLGLGGACLDIPFTVLCSTMRHYRHRRLHSAVDVIDAAGQRLACGEGSTMASSDRPVTLGRS
ncbi:uncharacterized protein DS421_19g651770 [Arachis hypogaea]|uniref:Uncharacterized protein n=1 Tax=Arachis hypogaea TaxID=3818 RepID=A0A6B9V7X3_ARAHY|nr:uncharacterized protein DS421_19g651770 [Arachis hypogaea]